MKAGYKIDEDRQYLTGFSMGCGGALRLAAETPDIWAGVNLASGLRGGPNSMLDNIAKIPLMLWAGELDPSSEGRGHSATSARQRA